MNLDVIRLVTTIASIVELVRSNQLPGLKADALALVEKLQAELPEKPDGSAWTEEDVIAAAAAARSPWFAVLARV